MAADRGDRRDPAAAGVEPILIGRVAKAHGIRGEIKVHPFSESPEDFAHYRALVLVSDSGSRTCQVVRARPQGRQVIVALAGVDDRDAAEALVGAEVWVEREALPALDDDEFYWSDLVGLVVRTDQGRELGTVKGLFATGGHDVLVVAGEEGEYLIPASREFLVEVDEQQGIITVTVVPGLLEINR